MQRGLLIVISGPSGVGKGTLIAALLKRMPELSFSVSATTRPPRQGEKEGVHYFFMSRAEFEKRIQEDAFLEWAKVHDDAYGTPRDFVEAQLAQGQDVVLDIDVQGGIQVKKRFPEGVFIFILPPDFQALRSRLLSRGTEPAAEIEHRLLDAVEELRHTNEYEYLVTNGNVPDAVAELEGIVRAERLKSTRRP